MSHTWEYRFAFRVESTQDAPEEFRPSYEHLVRAHGEPRLCFFSPSVREEGWFTSPRTAPRLWMLFQESLALLSLERRSNAISTYEIRRHDLLGFGQAEFLLNCWFSVYPGNPGESDGPLRVRFPSRASGKYETLVRTLLDWQEDFSMPEDHSGTPQEHVFRQGLPHKYTNYMEMHPEAGRIIEQFFQPRMIVGRARGESFPNLLLALTSRAIIALCDQSRHGWSEYGIEARFFPLDRVSLIEWTGRDDSECGAIRMSLQGMTRHTEVAWNVFDGLKPYALRWISALESTLKLREKERGRTGSTGSSGCHVIQWKV
jgi:hypothetical protein